ncbi:MAG TPA: hypothetical protein VNL98_11695 [Gemmatimonadales bacterium]|nr:hypothetical protein [Gemmatimonadales bacterium]
MTKKLLVGAGLVWLALGAAGCSKDGDVASPATELAEGSVVTGTIVDAIEASRYSGVEAPTRRAVSAPLTGGFARAPGRAGGVIASLTRESAAPTRSFQVTDRLGRAHSVEVRLERGAIGSIRHEMDGQLLLDINYAWQSRGRGAVLAERVLRLYHRGDLVVTQRRTFEDALIAATSRASGMSLAALGRGIMAVFAPQPLEAQSLRCLDRFVIYALAAGALSLAVDAFVVAPSPATYAALSAAIAAWNVALDNWLMCEFPAEM